jgi:hypothetical protein
VASAFKHEFEAVLSSAFETFAAQLNQPVDHHTSAHQGAQQHCMELVCYGIGSFRTNYKAQYQLALLLEIEAFLKVADNHDSSNDPICQTNKHCIR